MRCCLILLTTVLSLPAVAAPGPDSHPAPPPPGPGGPGTPGSPGSMPMPSMPDDAMTMPSAPMPSGPMAPAPMPPASDAMTAGPLIGGLAHRLGVSDRLAEGGVGALILVARQRLSENEVDRLLAVLPDADHCIAVANKLGITPDAIAGGTRLQSALGTMGYSSRAASGFPTAISKLTGGAGGPAADLLSKAMAAR